jgi:hypothetical protein
LTLHHVTGRPSGASPYFDPDLVFEVCLRCNIEQDHVWRRAGLYEPMPPVCVRLLRAALWFDIVAARRRRLTLSTTQARALARLLRHALQEFAALAAERRADLGGWLMTFESQECHDRLRLAPPCSRALAQTLREAASSLRELAR